MEFRTKREAEEAAAKLEQHGRLCDRAARKNARIPALAAEKRWVAENARAGAARIRDLLPTLPEEA